MEGIMRKQIKKGLAVLLMVAMVVELVLSIGMIKAFAADATVTYIQNTVASGGTINISNCSNARTTITEYTLNGGNYTITGGNSATDLRPVRFIIKENSTITLNNTHFKAGLIYKPDGCYYDGSDMGIFEIADGKTVAFNVIGSNSINTDPDTMDTVEKLQVRNYIRAILLGKNSTVNFEGNGSLDLGGNVAPKISANESEQAHIYMKSGNVSVGGFGFRLLDRETINVNKETNS